MTQPINIAGHLPGTQQVYSEGGMEYYLYLPPGSAPEGGWPVLIYLHGIGQAMHNYIENEGWVKQEIDEVKKHGSPAFLCEANPPAVPKLVSSFLVISPQFPFDPIPEQRLKNRQGREWSWSEQVSTIDTILDNVIRNSPVDQDRIYATGFSLGGHGAVTLAKDLKKHKVSKLVLVDSVPQALLDLPGIPIWMHYGGAGTHRDINNAHTTLINNSGTVVWKYVPEGILTPPGPRLFTDWHQNHTDTNRRACSDSRVYDWLLA